MSVGKPSPQSCRASAPVGISIPGVPPKRCAHLMPPTPCTQEAWHDTMLRCLLENDHDGLDWLSRHRLSDASSSGARVVEARMPSAPSIDLHVPASPVLDRVALLGLFRWLAIAGSHPIAVDLSGQQLEPAMTDALATILKTAGRLTSLKLIDCMLTDPQIQSVCAAMAGNKSVLALHLCANSCSQSATS